MGTSQKTNVLVFGLVAVVCIVLLIAGLKWAFPQQSGIGDGEIDGDGEGGNLAFPNCPTDGDSSLTINVFNPSNVTGSENYDVTAYVIEDGNIVATITDTTAPTATNVDCGREYTLKVVGTDGASGDSSSIKSFTSNVKSKQLSNGNLVFTTDRSNVDIRLNIEQHATLECKAFDNVNNGYVFDNADGSATDYETDGVTWTSTTNNATAYTETAGIDMDFMCRSAQSDTNYNDRGVYVLLEAPVGSWDEPSVIINSQSLSNIKGTSSVNTNEGVAYTDYEYVYKIPSTIIMKDGAEGFTLNVKMNLKSGQASASADPQIDLAVISQSLATNGQSVLESAVSDASTPAQVIAIYDMTIDVT